MSYRLAALVLLFACGSDEIELTSVIGATCDDDLDCDERCLPASNDVPEGFCTLNCATNLDCPTDADCVDKEGGVCLFICIDDLDCGFLGPNWICRAENLREDQNTQTRICLGD